MIFISSITSFYIRSVNLTPWFVSNPEDGFSRNETHIQSFSPPHYPKRQLLTS